MMGLALGDVRDSVCAAARRVWAGVSALTAFARPGVPSVRVAAAASVPPGPGAPGLPPPAPLATHATLADYVRTIDAFVATRPDLGPVRAYNHAMVDALDGAASLAGRTLLDVGASPHGFSLERALEKGARLYVGVGLGIWEPAEVRYLDATGRLLAAYGEDLPLEPESVDAALSLSTFEHFLDGAAVLREIHRVLRPGGALLVNFEPIWSSSAGHHLHHFGAVARVIPPWAHLLWTPVGMRRALESRWPADAPLSLEEAVAWVYDSRDINRLDVAALQALFEASPFTIEWMVPLLEGDDEDKRRLAAYLATLLPYSPEQLLTRGFSILMRKAPRADSQGR